MKNPVPRQPDSDVYRLLVQEVKDYAIFVLNPTGIILTWNVGARRLKGYAADEIIGHHFSIFYSKEDVEAKKPEHELTIAAKEGRVEDEGWRYRKDGTRFWASVIITAIHDQNGDLVGFGEVTRDITERRNTQEALAQAASDLESRVAERTAELEEANRTKDEFLATLSHELRTPLTAIVGWVQMLRAGSLSQGQAAHALDVINRNLSAQTQLIDDLLNISRIVSGKLKIEPRLADAVPVISEALESVKLSIEAKQLRLELDLDQSIGPLRIDPTRFQQVVWNLLSNAIKFTPRGGSIRVGFKRYANQAVLSVGDTGEGISAEFLPFVFERFRQADSTRSRKHGGLGLGLAIVRHLVELHGGTVSVASPGAGRGSTFSVTLPLPALTNAEQNTVLRQTGVLNSLLGIRILVVEDEADTREMVVHALENNGAVVKEAGSAGEALKLLEGTELDVLVSDIGMPDMDGFSFLRTIRKTTKAFQRIPAVALTAYATEDDRVAAIQAGFDAHLPKPVALPELIRTVTALHHRH